MSLYQNIQQKEFHRGTTYVPASVLASVLYKSTELIREIHVLAKFVSVVMSSISRSTVDCNSTTF